MCRPFGKVRHPALEANEWFGVFVPANTPSATVSRLNVAIRTVVNTSAFKTALAKLAVNPVGETPKEFVQMIKSDFDRWGPIVKASGFTPGRLRRVMAILSVSTLATNGGNRETSRHRTPDQILGPYFPTGQAPASQADLTSFKEGDGLAQGEIIEVTGRILNLDGEAVRSVPITIWQANAFGRYAHGNDPNPAPLDPNFIAASTSDPTTTAFIASKR